ncbi:hypothetical protein F444_01981 [Phytophthora nicotianae P1976]|uniref:Uncharacterized protein n=1 Tax=Phytophthora nicotianae P1976 TaxID=1317066 RepID=A0A081AYX2_PHYNI|nr:hypothetical protein F444_01981 [Phytophthora nicotianae P1976]
MSRNLPPVIAYFRSRQDTCTNVFRARFLTLHMSKCTERWKSNTILEGSHAPSVFVMNADDGQC